MFYSIKAYESKEDFENRRFVSLFGPEFESLKDAFHEAALWLDTYPVLKVESDDLEEIVVLSESVSSSKRD